MNKWNNKSRRNGRINALKRAIEKLKEDGYTEITALLVQRELQRSKNDDANIRQVASRLSCYQKELNIKAVRRDYTSARGWHGGSAKMTYYEIL